MVFTFDNSLVSEELLDSVKYIQEAIVEVCSFQTVEEILSAYLNQGSKIILAEDGQITLSRKVKEGTITMVFDTRDNSGRELFTPISA